MDIESPGAGRDQQGQSEAGGGMGKTEPWGSHQGEPWSKRPSPLGYVVCSPEQSHTSKRLGWGLEAKGT